MKITKSQAIKNFSESKYGIYIVKGTLMFRLDRQTGETWVYARQQWNPVPVGKLPLDTNDIKV